MSWFHRVRRAIADLFGRNRFEREMDEELQIFLDLSARDQERAGVKPADARRAAHSSFGGVEACRERLRDLRTGACLDSLGRDLRHSIRLLRRHPSFALAAIVTIAIGTFPLAASVGLANWLFLQPAPGVTNAGRLVHVELVTRDETGDEDDTPLWYLNYADVMRRVKGLTGLAGRFEGSGSIAVPGVDALHVDIDFVMHDYFRILGMQMAAGRYFTADEDREPGGSPVVILGHALAVKLFGSQEAAPGRAVLVNGLDFTVVGVAPPGFRGLNNDQYAQMWLPGATRGSARHVARERWDHSRGGGAFSQFVGRLAPDTDLDQARSELRVAIQAIAGAHPAENRRLQTADIRMTHAPGMVFTNSNTSDPVALMMLMFTSTGALLLVLAGANVGNLLLFRGSRRRDEMALRTALGASRWRLLRAQLMEIGLLSVLGGALGLLLTTLLASLLDSVIIPNAGFVRLPIDWRVGGLVLAAALVVGFVFGAASSAFGSAAGMTFVVRRMGTGRGRRLRNTLTVVQLAISLSLLVGAILLLATIRNVVTSDVGFDPTLIASADVTPHDNGYDEARSLVFYRTLLDRAAAMPAVSAISVSGGAPLAGLSFGERVQAAGGDRDAAIRVATNGISEDYFRVLQLPMLRGRGFSKDEAFAGPDGTCGPVVISESLALRLFGTREALDRVVLLFRRVPLECHVVGVAADVRMSASQVGVTPILYRPLGRSTMYRAVILARSRDNAETASAALREAGASIDPALPMYGRSSLSQAIDFQLTGRRIMSTVLGALAAMGLVMAAVGLYGLIAETVVDRKREFAVRLAIGADARRILLAVLRRAIVLAMVGTAAGIALSVALAAALRSQLFGVTVLEPSAYLSAAALLALVVLLASLAPAIRAARTNPVDALRTE